MRVVIDDKSGFCFGVVEAIGKAEELVKSGKTIYSLGDIVHNDSEVNRLGELGLKTVCNKDLPTLGGQKLLIRAHGEPPKTYSLCEECGIEVVDATCRVVAKLQKLVRKAYAQMKPIGGQVVILGKKGHAEIVGLNGQIDQQAVIIEKVEDLEGVDFGKPIFLLSQTTQSLTLFADIRAKVLERAVDPQQVTVRDTICRQVAGREEHLREFAKQFDVIIFVCGHQSSNGQILYDACRSTNPRSYKIETADELEMNWFEGAESVGICGATSTPQRLMQEVATRIIF